jgi:hypothetical protein
MWVEEHPGSPGCSERWGVWGASWGPHYFTAPHYFIGLCQRT